MIQSYMGPAFIVFILVGIVWYCVKGGKGGSNDNGGSRKSSGGGSTTTTQTTSQQADKSDW